MTKVKICGITNNEDAINAVNSGADYLGFNFYKLSPRYIGKNKAKRIIENLPKNVKAVGIFVNETANKIKDIADFCNLDLVQLSGDENAEFLSNLKKTTNQKIIKAFRIGIGKKFPKENFFPIADYILLDSFKKGGYGGTGKVFDWSMAKTIDKKIMFLSGGLNTSNVKIAIRKLNPYCVDVCSGIEKSPGRKDFMKMKEFIIQAKVR